MLKRSSLFYVLVLLILFLGIGTWTISQAQQGVQPQRQEINVLRKGDLKQVDKTKISPPTQQEVKEATAPIGDYNFKPAPGEKAKKWKARNDKFKARDFKGNLVDVSKSTLNEMSAVSGEQAVWSNFKKQPAFPIDPDTIVVIGTITNTEAFITETKSTIYSEFTFEINELLKSSVNGVLPPKMITLNRWGGRIKLPSGKILYRGFQGKFYPQKDKTYLMFIKRNGEEDYFSIITGYEFTNNVVRPLDGRRSDGQYIRQYKDYEKFEGKPINEFINIVKNEINVKRGNEE